MSTGLSRSQQWCTGEIIRMNFFPLCFFVSKTAKRSQPSLGLEQGQHEFMEVNCRILQGRRQRRWTNFEAGSRYEVALLPSERGAARRTRRGHFNSSAINTW